MLEQKRNLVEYFCEAECDVYLDHDEHDTQTVERVWYAHIVEAESRGQAKVRFLKWLVSDGIDLEWTYPVSIRKLPTSDISLLHTIDWYRYRRA
jgi:hypothetical protein